MLQKLRNNTHTHTHTSTHRERERTFKMADDMNEGIENALNKIVCTTEQSGNTKKDLKQTIYETVSTLRKLFIKLKDSYDSKTRAISEFETLVAKKNTQLEEVRSRPGKGHGAPSLIPRQEPASSRAWGLALLGEENAKLYSKALRGKIKQTRYKLTVTSKKNQQPESIRGLLKTKINPTDIKVGINSLKTLRDGRLQIETGSKEEVEILTRDITEKCGETLDVNVHRLRIPRLVIYNILEDISTENTEETLLAQNPEFNLKTGDITAKFAYETRKHTWNLVIEVRAQTWKLLIQKKVKIGWLICSIEDYLVANRCFKCSRFNHRSRDCRGTETCPHCSGCHRLKERTVQPTNYKCIKCQLYNMHN